jgi:hypothetical protein
LERSVLEAADAFAKEQESWRRIEQARIERERAELQKRAPGLDMEGRILQPIRTAVAVSIAESQKTISIVSTRLVAPFKFNMRLILRITMSICLQALISIRFTCTGE